MPLPSWKNAAAQRLKSVCRRPRIAWSKSGGRMPKRPAMTWVLRVQSLSVLTTEGAFRRVWPQEGCDCSMATPKRGNLDARSVVMKATTWSPGDSATPITTQGRRFVPDKSVNGNAARTMSPTCGMSAEIRVLLPAFDIGVGIKVGLRREKVESSTLMRDSRHRLAGKLILRLRHDEHQFRRGARPSLRGDAHKAGCIHLHCQRFHGSKLTHAAKVPSFLASPTQGACLWPGRPKNSSGNHAAERMTNGGFQ